MKVMVNGLPGNMATLIANRLFNEDHEVVSHSLTGPEIEQSSIEIQDIPIHLISGDEFSSIREIREIHGPFMAVDFTHPKAAEDNVVLYCKFGLPFVMGTTGGDAERIKKLVEESGNTAVLAPNMASPIVAFQAAFEHIAQRFPGVLKNYNLEVCESHQQGKADTSGTAKAMVHYFDQLGCAPFTTEQIEMIRDPEAQRQMGIPEEYLSGHGYHSYSLVSPDDTVELIISHNVNGRNVYVDGTMLALEFLSSKVAAGERGLYSMIDVLSAE